MRLTFSTQKIFILLAIIVISLGSAPRSFANEPLSFFDAAEALRSPALRAHDAFYGHQVAQTDLNDDGLDEYIVRPHADNGNALHDFVIYALGKDETLKTLGRIHAKTVTLGRKYQNGVRNLRVFADGDNDFGYDVYTWDAAQSRYTLSKQKD